MNKNYLLIKVNGKNIYKFLLKCKNNNISLYNIKNISNKEIIIKININDYKKIKQIKSSYKLKVINKTGLIKIKEIILRYKYLTMFFILSILLLYILSNIIFEVVVISDNYILRNKIIKELNYYDIKKYSFKKSYEIEQKIKEKILKRYKSNIEWLEITRTGTKYEIQVVERKKEKKEKQGDVSNIVAAKSGIVKNIFVISGEKVIDTNTYVNKGETLISGILMNNENIKGLVNSKGKVYAEVWYNLHIEYPLKYKEKVYTNKMINSPYIKLGKKYFERKKFKYYKRNKKTLYKSKLLPFEIGFESLRKIKYIKQNLSYKEARKKAIIKAKEKLMNNLSKNEYIIDEKTLNFYEKNSKINMDVFFSCYEEIGKEKNLNKNDIEKITETKE